MKQTFLLISHIILLYCVGPFCLSAQENILNLKFRHYTMEEGLLANSVQCLLQDRTGYIWLGTGSGLCRFDGTRFSSPLSREPIAGITAMCEGKERIWVGTDQGLCLYNPQTDSLCYASVMLPDSTLFRGHISALAIDDKGALWCSTMGHGVLCLQPGAAMLEQYVMPDGNTLLASLLIDSSRQIWSISNWGSSCCLYRLNQRSRCFEPYYLTDASGAVQLEGGGLALHQSPDGRFLIGTWTQGLVSFDARSHQMRYDLPAAGHSLNHIHTITQYDERHLLIGSDEGLTLFDTQSLRTQHYTSDELNTQSLNDQFVYPVMLDREGGLWVGSFYGGVDYAHPRSGVFVNYLPSRFANSVNGRVISRFCEDQFDHLWIASDDGGLTCFDYTTESFRSIPLASKGEPQRNVHAICQVGEELWIGNYSKGIDVLNLRTGRLRNLPGLHDAQGRLISTSSYALFLDRDEQLWAGTFSEICRYSPSSQCFEVVKHFGYLVIDIDQDEQGRLWVCSQGGGIWSYTPSTGAWRCYADTVRQSARKDVNALTIDPKGRIWVGGQEGLLRYDAAQDSFLEVPLPGLSRCEVKSILCEGEQLWIGSSEGLLCYTPDSEETPVQVYTGGDGLSSVDFMPNAAYKARDGRLLFGTTRGINAFYPSQVTVNQLLPPVVFTELEVYNQPVRVGSDLLPCRLDLLDCLELSHEQNVIAVSFSALSFCLPQQNQYAYWLEGFDRKGAWIESGNQHKAIYTHLSPGEYVLHVRASNNDGCWGPESCLRIRVAPPFYWNLYAWLFYFAVLLVLAVLLFRYLRAEYRRRQSDRIRQIREDAERQNNEQRIRFFTLIAHEIRTPVSLITAPLKKALEESERLPEGVRHNLAIVERNGHRLLQLVNQLLDFRKYQEGAVCPHMRPTPLAELLRSIIIRFEPTLQGSHISIDVTLPPDDFAPCLDAEAVTRLVSNLLNNARKFTSSHIWLSVVCLEGEERFTITVRDDGPGIDAASRQRIFEPFFQVREDLNTPGTGLGLSIVQHVVEEHQGSIRVDSSTEAPTFTAFVVTLPANLPATEADSAVEVPVAAPAVAVEPEVETASANPEQTLPSLLLVDDNEEMLHFLTESLRGQYLIHTATNGRQALQILSREMVSLVVSDWMMPVMDGRELCESVRNNPLTSHVLFVLLTAKTDDASRVEGMNCGADAYIEKPFSLDYLQACVGNLIRLRRMLIKKYQVQPLAPIEGLSSTPVDADFLSRLETLIELNLSNPDLSVDFLCSHLAISRSGLFAKMKNLADVSPNQMIQLIRLKRAARLLKEGHTNVTEVAYQVGFSSLSYFTKCFTKQFGMPPTSF